MILACDAEMFQFQYCVVWLDIKVLILTSFWLLACEAEMFGLNLGGWFMILY